MRQRRDSLDPTSIVSFKGSDSDVHSSSDSDGGTSSLNILLLVHSTSRSRLANLLGTSGHILTIASTSDELLEACERTSKGFDIFLCHLKCFREGNDETRRWEDVLQAVRDKYENVKIITLAKETHGEIPKAVRSIELGAAAFFRLPMFDEDFLNRIQKVSNFTSGTVLTVDNGDPSMMAEIRDCSPGGPKISSMCVSNLKQATSIIGTVDDLFCIIVAESADSNGNFVSKSILDYFESRTSTDRVPIICACPHGQVLARSHQGIHPLNRPMTSDDAIKCLKDVLAQRRLNIWIERSMSLSASATYYLPSRVRSRSNQQLRTVARIDCYCL